jgi:hypothetical protein
MKVTWNLLHLVFIEFRLSKSHFFIKRLGTFLKRLEIYTKTTLTPIIAHADRSYQSEKSAARAAHMIHFTVCRKRSLPRAKRER